MELDSWRLVSSIPRDWSNSGFPAAFLFERTQIVFWTFFHSWRNEEAYHLPPLSGSHVVCYVLRKKKKKGGEEEGRFYALCGAHMVIKPGCKDRRAPERSAAARSAGGAVKWRKAQTAGPATRLSAHILHGHCRQDPLLSPAGPPMILPSQLYGRL